MSDDRCICIDLRTAAQKLTQAYDGALAASGITVTQLSQLHLIQTLNGPTLSELAQASELERSTLGRNIKVLQKLGLVATQAGEDARTRTIHITPEGKRAFDLAAPKWFAVQDELLQRLGHDGRAQLDALLAALTTPLEASAS